MKKVGGGNPTFTRIKNVFGNKSGVLITKRDSYVLPENLKHDARIEKQMLLIPGQIIFFKPFYQPVDVTSNPRCYEESRDNIDNIFNENDLKTYMFGYVSSIDDDSINIIVLNPDYYNKRADIFNTPKYYHVIDSLYSPIYYVIPQNVTSSTTSPEQVPQKQSRTLSSFIPSFLKSPST